MTQTVQIRCGVYELEMELAGHSIAALRRSLGGALNIDPAAVAVVSGELVGEDYAVVAGDRVEFVRQAGRKGVSPLDATLAGAGGLSRWLLQSVFDRGGALR